MVLTCLHSSVLDWKSEIEKLASSSCQAAPRFRLTSQASPALSPCKTKLSWIATDEDLQFLKCFFLRSSVEPQGYLDWTCFLESRVLVKTCEGEHTDEGIGPCALLAPCAGRNGLVQTSDLIGKSLSFEPRSAAASGQCARWLESNYLLSSCDKQEGLGKQERICHERPNYINPSWNRSATVIWS